MFFFLRETTYSNFSGMPHLFEIASSGQKLDCLKNQSIRSTCCKMESKRVTILEDAKSKVSSVSRIWKYRRKGNILS